MYMISQIGKAMRPFFANRVTYIKYLCVANGKCYKIIKGTFWRWPDYEENTCMLRRLLFYKCMHCYSMHKISCCVGQSLNQPLTQLLVSLTSKVGVALIVSNDYAANDSELAKLHGTHKDADRMHTAFSKLGYAVFHCTNMTYYELTDIIDHVAMSLPFSSCKRLVFVFSGYGTPDKQLEDRENSGEDKDSSGGDEENSGEEDDEDISREKPKEDKSGQLYTQEGWTISIAEILDAFGGYQYPKILLLNLCHSLMPGSEWSADDNFLNLDHFSEDNHFIVAYSALPYRELQSGSLWIELLSKAIQNEDIDIKIILSDVNSTLRELYSSIPLFEARFDDKLSNTINFLAESPTNVPMPVQASLTKSSTDKLQEYCQEYELGEPDFAVIPTQGGGGFYSTVTIGGETYTGAIRLDKEEAKKSAAEVFFQLLILSKSGINNL